MNQPPSPADSSRQPVDSHTLRLSTTMRRILLSALAALLIAILAAACGDDGGTTTSPTTTAGTGTTTGAPTTTGATTTTGGAVTTASATTIEVGYTGGAITGGGKRSAPLGKPVVIKVTSDVADEIHVHGYDKKADAGPGKVATISFVADKPGIFEVELEKKGLKLFELEVK